jgi:hypothetical protein
VSDDQHPSFPVGTRVDSDYGVGTVKESSLRRLYIVLDNYQGAINVVVGTPGFDRLVKL